MHFSQSKSTKCEIYAWNCDFSWTTYCRDLQQVPLDLAYLKPWICTTQGISIHFSQSKSTKCDILAVSWTLPDNKLKKKLQFAQGKVFCKGLPICTCRFLGMAIAMHFVTTLCDKYFLNYYGFPAFVMGRSRYWVLKHGVRVKCDPRRTAAYVPSHFHGFEPHFAAMCLLKLWFFMNQLS